MGVIYFLLVFFLKYVGGDGDLGNLGNLGNLGVVLLGNIFIENFQKIQLVYM